MCQEPADERLLQYGNQADIETKPMLDGVEHAEYTKTSTCTHNTNENHVTFLNEKLSEPKKNEETSQLADDIDDVNELPTHSLEHLNENANGIEEPGEGAGT